MTTFIAILYFINLIFALFLIFYRERDTSVTWAWLLVFVFLPFLGFILYLFFGLGLSNKEKFVIKEQTSTELIALRDSLDPDHQLYDDRSYRKEYKQLVRFISNLNQTPLTHHNKVKILTDGREKIDALKEDIKQATEFIHLEYYAFVTDEIGMEIVDLLVEKAAQGVEVRLLYDELGSKGIKKEKLKPLIDNGGFTQTFITSQKPILKFRANYHDHRKIVVIDGKIGYTGGFNIADQYVYTTEKFGYWRDTHARIVGPAISLLELRFLTDWNVSVKPDDKIKGHAKYFYGDTVIKDAQTDVQIVASGPNNDKEQIKLAFAKMIIEAKERIWIQTPYFIPDDTILDALRIAKYSGIDVKIMIPNKPDHPFIYRATEYYAQVAMNNGVDIYIYDGGFLHSKVLIMDDTVSIVGSANQDIRSYKLNFEASAVMYDPNVNETLSKAFENDLKVSKKMTPEMIRSMSLWIRFKQKIARLFSPIM